MGYNAPRKEIGVKTLAQSETNGVGGARVCECGEIASFAPRWSIGCCCLLACSLTHLLASLTNDPPPPPRPAGLGSLASAFIDFSDASSFRRFKCLPARSPACLPACRSRSASAGHCARTDILLRWIKVVVTVPKAHQSGVATKPRESSADAGARPYRRDGRIDRVSSSAEQHEA